MTDALEPTLSDLWNLLQQMQTRIAELESQRSEVRVKPPRRLSRRRSISRAALLKTVAATAAGLAGGELLAGLQSEAAHASGPVDAQFVTVSGPPSGGAGTGVGVNASINTTFKRGVDATGTEAGVAGTSSAGNGVTGTTAGNASGVYGVSTNGGYGVTGRSYSDVSQSSLGPGFGVQGESASYGVMGQISLGIVPSWSDSSVAVYGRNYSNRGYGVLGESRTPQGALGDAIGVQGETGSGVGVQGNSSSGNGVMGTTASNSASGVYGVSTNGGYGVAGRSFSDVNQTQLAASYGVLGESALCGVFGRVSPESPGASYLNSAGVYGLNATAHGFGVIGDSAEIGVLGLSGVAAGVKGETGGPGADGVYGSNTSSSGNGVHGRTWTDETVKKLGAGTGVLGEAGDGVGVQGTNNSTANPAVRGVNTSTGAGVQGTNVSTGTGVKGSSNGGSAIQGVSGGGSGGYFLSTQGNGVQVTQGNKLTAVNTLPTLQVTRSGATSSNFGYTGDLIFANDTPNTSAGGDSTGNLLRLQRKGVDMVRVRGDGLGVFTRGVQVFAKAGAPTDADFAAGAPGNGTIVADASNNKLWVRLGGVWKSVQLT